MAELSLMGPQESEALVCGRTCSAPICSFIELVCTEWELWGDLGMTRISKIRSSLGMLQGHQRSGFGGNGVAQW